MIKLKELVIIISSMVIMSAQMNGQNVGIGDNTFTPDNSALLEIRGTKGLLIPRMTTAQRDSMTSSSTPAQSLLIFNTTTKCYEGYVDGQWNQLWCSNHSSCGSQIWMAANMNVGTRIDGTSEQNNNSVVEKYCYNDVEANCDIYGGLYQWAEAMQIDYTYNTTDYPTDYTCDPCGSSGRQGICPSGYHIPTDLEWSRYEYCVESSISPTGSTSLSTFQNNTGWRGSTNNAGPGAKMKVTSSNSPSWDGTNASGFAALPAGFRNTDGSFNDLGSSAFFWSASEYSSTGAWSRGLYSGYSQSYRGNYNKKYGFSVRCLKN